MRKRKIKTYSTYINPKSDEYNKEEVKKGSIIVAKLSDYEKLKPKIKDHKRESVVVLIDKDKNLGVVYLHGIKDKDRFGKPIKQGKIFKKTNRKFNNKEILKIEKHLFTKNGRISHSIRTTIKNNKEKANKKTN